MNSTSVFLCLMAGFLGCDGLKRTMKIDLSPNNSTLDGLGCALSIFDDSSRCVEFETLTGTCRPIDAALSSSPETGKNYFKVLNVKHDVRQTSIFWPLPANFKLGDSLILFVKNFAGASEPVHFEVSLFGFADGYNFVYNVGMFHKQGTTEGKIYVSSHIEGSPNGGKEIPDPFQNGTVKFEILVREFVIQVSADDVGFLNLSSGVSHLASLYMTFDSTKSTSTVLIGTQYIYRN